MAGRYGNIPPGFPGAPKNKPSPTQNMAKVSSPIGPGATKNRASPKVPTVGSTGSKDINSPNPLTTSGTPSKKSSPKFRGIPGREGSITPGKQAKTRGMSKNAGNQLKAAGAYRAGDTAGKP